MPIPFVWLAGAGLLALGKWYTGSILYHGGDHKAAWESVSKKMTAAAQAVADSSIDGAKFMKDFAIVSTAVVQLKNSSDLNTLAKGCRALKRALDTLPKETIAGLNKVFNIDKVIDEALKTTLAQCGLALLEQDAEGLSSQEIMKRTYFATYLVGRSGEVYDPEIKPLAVAILGNHHLHIGTPADVEIAETLAGYAPSDAALLVQQLTDYTGLGNENQAGGLYTVYIAKALGGDITPKNDTLLIDEIITMFSET